MVAILVALAAVVVSLVNCACVPPTTIAPRSTAFPSGTIGRASCVGATGVQNITVRGGYVVELLCRNNVEYLVLPNVQSSNFATVQNLQTCVVAELLILEGFPLFSHHPRSHYCALRLDPNTLLIDVGDVTFATTTRTSGTS